MRFTFGSKLHFEHGSIQERIKDIVIGLTSGIVRAIYIIIVWIYVNTIQPLASSIFGINLPDGKHTKIPGNQLKVAAVGFGRTGTYSLTLALDELGYPTFHTIHMYAYENEEIMHMWSNKVVTPAFEQKQPIFGSPDLQLIAESGYDAIADLPSSLYFEQILQQYPNCKFILTTRENSEEWYRSWTTLTKSITKAMHMGGMIFPTLHHYSRYLRWIYAVVNKDSTYITSFFPRDDNIKYNAIATYEEHNNRVREVIPKNQLLEYNVKDGWGPLCKFLNVSHNDCPITPFPKSNSTQSIQVQPWAAFWAATFVILYFINKAKKSFTKNYYDVRTTKKLE